MTTTTTDEFIAAISTGGYERKHVTEDHRFIAMMYRQLRALEIRAIEDAQILPQVLGLVQRANEIVNVAIAANAERYGLDPHLGASRNECAKALGITPQAASQRKQVGERIMRERIESAGAVRLADKRVADGKKSPEVIREKAAIQAAHEHAVTHLDAYRARHAAA